MVLYCVMPSFARYIDNSYTNTISHVVISDTEILTSYNLYCALFLVSMAFFFRNNAKKNCFRFEDKGATLPNQKIWEVYILVYTCNNVAISYCTIYKI